MEESNLKPATRDLFREHKPKTNTAHVSNLNKINNNKSEQHQKETLIIEKDPALAPVESWRENTQVKVSKEMFVKLKAHFFVII